MRRIRLHSGMRGQGEQELHTVSALAKALWHLTCTSYCAGAFDSFLNIQITLVLLAQLTICLAFAVGSYAWRQTKGYDNYYLQFDQYSNGNYQSGIVYVIILFITFWILFSYLVPISLFVTIEIIKFVLVSAHSVPVFLLAYWEAALGAAVGGAVLCLLRTFS